MDLWKVEKSEASMYGDREIILYSNNSAYKIDYRSDSQIFTMKTEIEDQGYANYLYNKLIDDLNINRKVQDIPMVLNMKSQLEVMKTKCKLGYSTDEIRNDIYKLENLINLML